MKVLVTGATGLLGSHVTDLLIERGERPRVLVRPGDSLDRRTEACVDVHGGEMSDRASLERAVDGVDRVIHCAALTGPWGPEGEYEQTNVRGLETLVEVALAAGVRRVVHVSSVTVHGNDVGGAADETAPFRVERNPYSRSKCAAERVVETMIRNRGAPVTIVRPGWIYGPRDAASFGRLAAAIERGRMVIVGSGNNHVPLIHVRDAARGALLAAEADQATGKAYLLVNDEQVTQYDYVSAIARELGVRPPTVRLPYRLSLMLGAAAETVWKLTPSRRPPPLTRYGLQLLGGENRFDIGSARRELGFSPLIDLSDGVRESVEWYRRPLRAPDSAPVPA
jgi:2-alkyl-3-oxoalkanoate reductase